MKFIPVVFGLVSCLSVWILPAIAQEPTCDLTRSVYQDADGQGFQLEFAPDLSGSAVTLATATLTHPDRGTIFEFSVAQSQGYGAIGLVNSNNPEAVHGIYFFGSDLRRSSVLIGRGNAPTYAFVEGLGSTDYYSNQNSGSRDIILGDVMWQLAYCKQV